MRSKETEDKSLGERERERETDKLSVWQTEREKKKTEKEERERKKEDLSTTIDHIFRRFYFSAERFSNLSMSSEFFSPQYEFVF